jgi:hypothetical protein
MSTRSTASRQPQPPLRFPKVERPPVPPAGSSDLPQAVTPLPVSIAAQGINSHQGNPTLPGSPHPSNEELQAFPARRLIATPEEVLQAQVRELDHVLREALDRLADADHRISQLEAESTRFRDTVLPVMEDRIAATERLTFTRLVNQEALAATQVGHPLSGKVSDKNLPRESVAQSGRRGKVRSGKRDKNIHEKGEHSETSSNSGDGSSSSDDFVITTGLHVKGRTVPGLKEIIPARSDYANLVSYRSYRLANRSNRYDASVTGKLSSYLKRMKHAIPQEDRFSGDEPIEVLSFLRVFKEASDHNELTEAAAARVILYFLTGAAKEGYRAHLDEAPSAIPTYPYMVQYLLETYAVDDELAQAYMAVTTAKQAENEGEKAFGRRLHRLAIKAGNVIDKRDLTTIYVEGLLPFVQSGLRMHLLPGMSFETVQRHAHNLGVSLRHTIKQSTMTTPPKYPPGVKGLITRTGPVQAVHSVEGVETEEQDSGSELPSLTHLEAALATVQASGGYPSHSGTSRTSWRANSSRSPSPSVGSIPTRGWASPGGSIASEPTSGYRPTGPTRTGITKSVLCFLCYESGHYLSECPRLPSILQREATSNREAYYRSRDSCRPVPAVVATPSRIDMASESQPKWSNTSPVAMTSENTVSDMDAPVEVDPIPNEGFYSLDGSENISGGN